jgi:DNA-directed RNA polymerase subunit M/transcription elongation factor TFIIS
MKDCLKCGYQRLPTDTGPDYSCPKCGAVYAKVEAALAEKIRQQAKQPSSGSVFSGSPGVESPTTSPELSTPSQPTISMEKPSKGANEKFCSECAAAINAKAEICPKCGVRQMSATVTDADIGKSAALPVDKPIGQGEKKKSIGFFKGTLYLLGIGLAASVVMPIIGGKGHRTSVALSEPQTSADDVCRDKGDNVAKVYFANLSKMIEQNILASEMMNEACQKNTQGMECQKLCEDGFKYRAKQFVKD